MNKKDKPKTIEEYIESAPDGVLGLALQLR